MASNGDYKIDYTMVGKVIKQQDQQMKSLTNRRIILWMGKLNTISAHIFIKCYQ